MWEKPGGAPPPDPGLQERAGAEEQRAEGPLGIPGVSSLASFKPRGRHRWIHRWPVFLSLVLTLTALGVAHRKTKDTRLSSPRIHIETKPVYPDSRHQQQYPTKKPTAASPKKRYESSFAIAEAKEEAVQTRFKDSKEARGEVRDRPIPSEDWQLPLAEETDRSLRGKLARKLLAQITRECIDKSIEANETLLSEEEEELATAAAETLTQGESQELEGLEMRLVNVLPLGRAVQEQAFQGPVLTTRVLGSGISNNLFVEAVEPGKGYSVTLQLHMCVTGEEGNLSLEAANRWVDIAKETRSLVLACGNSPVSSGGSSRGLLVADHLGAVVLMQPNHPDGKKMLFQRVEVYERLLSNLEPVVFLLQKQTPEMAVVREYIATRLVLQALYLQQAGVCHNALSWRNVFVSQKGSFFLGGLEILNPMGEALSRRSSLDPHYTEPQLMKDFVRSFREDVSAFTHEKSDMWSLGVMLFELFSGESFSIETRDAICNGTISTEQLANRMRATGHSDVWVGLVQGLLKPNRNDRLSGAEVATIFKQIWAKTSDTNSE